MSAVMLDRLSGLWLQSFKGCNQRAHWHLLNFLRFEVGPLGATFAQAEGYLRARRGQDPDATRTRVNELSDLGLLTFVEESAQGIVNATPLLRTKYSKYHRDLVKHVSWALNFPKQNAGQPALDEAFERELYSTVQRIHREIDLSRESYIYHYLAEDTEQARAAHRAMQRRCHWAAFVSAWIASHEKEATKMTVSEIVRRAIPSCPGEGVNTIANSIRDLERWRFLRRLNQSEYVVTDSAERHFSNLFDSVKTLMFRHASHLWNIAEHVSDQPLDRHENNS